MSKTKNSMGNNKDYSSASSYTSSSLSSDEEEIDARDLKPIRDYLSDRKELARQLFRSVKPEKIRLMLPQVLKHMDLDELEEWCESELNGMSKARIVSILNGKPMLESSDTSESSDDSGPSLEIISDTEEWLTDDDTLKKENSGKGKIKKDKTKIKGKINKKNNVNKSNVKGKCNIKNENNDKTEIIEIKKEDDKGKEGDSLLDLLELEMRARAIRALIRKEEDIIPSINPSQTNDSQTTENDVGTSHDYKTKENYREQLERIISSQQNSKGEDEDVVLVIPKPAPVVELLSSDSDGEAREKVQIKTGKSVNNLNENERNSTKSSQDVKERKETQEIIEIHDNVAERRKKSKKKSRGKSQLISTIEKSSESKEINVIETTEQSHNKDIKITSRTNSSDENSMIVEEENKTSQKITEESKIEEERLTDLDEIDLDDYCEVMDIENSDEDKSQDKVVAPSQQENKQPVSQTALPKLDSAETWASRYYQTDDVQNVIKESKIQSEIRKRLRERQRLSKLNKSPNLNLSAQPSTTDAPTTLEKTPTGSVEEYLALKRSLNANVSTSNNNNIPQDNLTAVNTDNDIKAKDTVIQDENISCNQECTDNDNTPKVTSEASEAVIDKSAETVGDIKNDT
ncbi:hypothetical protein P5V15_002312 [Pogonomyrmex californicus]